MANKKVVWGSAAGIGAVVSVMLSGLYSREGGYVSDPLDRGGATRYGVTEKVARDAGYKGDMRVFPKECETEKAVCSDKIYYETYIDKPGFVPIIKASPPIGDEIFDTGVNMGPYYGSVFLQQSLNEVCAATPKLKVDGKIGTGTQTRFTQCQVSIGAVTFCKMMIKTLDQKQKDRYDAIVRNNPTQKRFYKGWINHRIGNVDLKRCDTGK